MKLRETQFKKISESLKEHRGSSFLLRDKLRLNLQNKR